MVAILQWIVWTSRFFLLSFGSIGIKYKKKDCHIYFFDTSLYWVRLLSGTWIWI